MLGAGSPAYVISLNNLAGLYWNMGNYVDAEALFREALENRRAAVGESSPGYAISLNNLANLMQVAGATTPPRQPLAREVLEAAPEGARPPSSRLCHELEHRGGVVCCHKSRDRGAIANDRGGRDPRRHDRTGILRSPLIVSGWPTSRVYKQHARLSVARVAVFYRISRREAGGA